ncbi:DUF6531 domain-containing protein [Kitasatospora sp. NBC_01287]|uniref:LamG-like jellyroll fold domain-containing protein n=1 Tax=Kitasatospora sp. NBC_01287 TaxID=2903573 RepID=UPI00224FB7AD|nr:LamG-like jellyroll fold domain-containing protein [Kitasatospora sp. NBC_01287]MCX4745893.1 DUF6531 domain-containing protein [Kitasatospora sp. NBC_01287]
MANSSALVDFPIDASHDVAYGLQGALPVTATASGDTLTYAGAQPSADVQYDALATGGKESLILHDASAPTVWTFPLQLTGVSVALDATGNAVFTDSSGQVRLTIPHGFMEDSAIDPKSDQGAMSDAVTYQLTVVNGVPALQMTLDSAWLHDPHRVFPVQVDPSTVSGVNVGQSTYVMSPFKANYSTQSVLKAGTYDGGGHVANSYLLFPVSSAVGKNYIQSVGLSLYDVWSYDCGQHEVDVSAISSTWNPSSINTYPGVSIGGRIGQGSFGAGTSCGSGSQWEKIDLGDSHSATGSQLVSSWAFGGDNLGLAVTSSSTDSNAWKQFASVNSSYPPYLYVTYADWAASSTVAGSYTQPTYNSTGSVQVTMTNLAANWWNSSSMQLKARVFDSNGNEQSVNAPLVGVSGLVQTGQSVTVNAVIPVLPKLGTQYSVCFDGYVNGTVSLHDSYGIPWQGCIGAVGQNTQPQIDSYTPLSGTVSGSLTPQLSAVGHDPDNYPGSGVNYDFQVYSADGRTKVADSGWQWGQSWSVPAGVLAWNTSYWWTVADGDQQLMSAWTSWSGISTQVQQPPITSHLGGAADDGQGHTFDPQVGNYTTTASDADVKSVGPALAVTRSYNSLDPRTGTLFGAGWTSVFDMRVQPDGDGSGSVVLTDASGRAERLGQDPRNASQYVPAAGEYETLTSVSGGFVLLLKSGMRYTFQTPVGSWYALTAIQDAEGHVQSLHYTGGLLDTVTDAASGRALHLSWTSGGRHVAKVITDPAAGGDASTALAWTYTYNGSNADELDQVCAPATGGNSAASCTTYSYTPGSHVRSATLDTNPSSYWRLGESSGTNAASEEIANQGNDVAQYVGGVSLGAPGAAVGSGATAASFDGSSSAVALPGGLLRNSYVSLGLWFKTTSPGVVAAYQNGPLSASPSEASPLLYVGTDGRLRGELYGPSIGLAPITSAGAVTDGAWHYALLTGSGGSQSLYLDGNAIGSVAGVINPLDQQNTYIGAGFTRGSPWPSVPAASGDGNSHFRGQIADVAVYDHTLGAPAVAAVYQAGAKASTELSALKLPSGKTKLAVSYDGVRDRATQVTDANGGTWKISQPSVSGSAQEYRGQVMGSTPQDYWRMSDQAGTQAANEIYSPRPTPNNGTYTGVTLGAAGPMTGSGGAASFDGSTSSVQLPSAMIPAQGPAGIALWFKTTGSGTLAGYQSTPLDAAQTPANASWNPALYVGSDGKLYGEFYCGGIPTPMVSASAVNDGKWHFAVLSADSGTSQSLYLDGQLSAGPLSGTIIPNGIHYLYLGAGNADQWPNAAATPFGHFTGQLADTAIFPHGLSAGTVSSLYTQATTQSAAQGVTPNTPSAYDTAITSNQPSGYWRLDDASGNQATELLSSAALAQNRGTQVNTTQGTAGPWASGTSTATTFNGTTSYLQLPPNAMPQAGANSTISLWFKTTAPGVLYSFQNYPLGNTSGGQSGAANRWNPALYVGSDNKLHGELWNGTPANTVSDTTVTDGQWHYAVLTANTTTQQLYLDGHTTGAPLTGTLTYNGNGYAYLGAGNVQGGWPNAPADTSGHLNGSLADFALYGYALDAGTIATQYQSATTASAGNGLDAASAFRTQVVQDSAFGYWRLNDPTGSWYAQDELGTALPDLTSGTYTSTTLGAPGPSGDPQEQAATFNGTNSLLQLPSNAAPTQGSASVELWFKTTTSGVLYSYQDTPMGGTPQANDPALYVGADGRLHGMFWSSPVTAMTSDRTVTDGQWHQAILTGDSTGQSIYLDGTQSASLTNAGPIIYNGAPYVYVGGGDVRGWNWPSTSAPYFSGQIAEVSYYPSRLTAAQAQGHYTAMRGAGGTIPVTTTTVTDPTGNALTYTYDTHTAKLVSYADASGNTTRYTYDTNGFLYSTTDPDGHTVTTGHDARGNTVSTTTCQNPSTCHTSYATYYLDGGNALNPMNDAMLTSSDARSNGPGDTTYTTTYTYNTAGQLTSTTLPATADFPKGRTTYTSYTTGSEAATGGSGTQPPGLPATVTNTLDTSAYGQAAGVPAAQESQNSYDAAGNLTRTVSPLGLTTTYTYDNLGRALSSAQACTNCGQGQTPTTTTTTYTWDGQGNPLTETDPATTDAVTGTVHTPRTTYTYDADGDKTAQTLADTTGADAPRTSTWAYYSTTDLLWQSTDPAGAKNTYTYDPYGNTATKTDPAGTNYQYSHSPQGWLQQTAIANYTGNPDNPLAAHWQVIDSRAYDPAGRLATDTDAMGRTTHTYYNDDNTVAEVDLDAFHNFNPTTAQFDGTTRNVVLQTNTYDAAGQLTRRITGGGSTTVANTYDQAGRATSTTVDPGGLNRITTSTYDATNSVLSSKLTDGTTTRETDNTYDTAGDLLTATVKNTPQNSTTTHTYDQRGLPLTTTSPNGNTTGATPANYTTSYFHDPAGQLAITDAPPTPTTVFNTTTGQPVTLPAAAAETRTGYNTFGEPAAVKDPDGNITTTTHTFDSTGEHLAVAANSYTTPDKATTFTSVTQVDYDAMGRPKTVTVDPSGLDRVSTTTYDQLGNPVQVTKPSIGGTTPTAQITYDLDGEPLSQTDPTGATTQATYDDLGREVTSTQIVRQPTAAAYTTTNTYDDAGDLTATLDPKGHQTTAHFDAAGERTSVTDALSDTTRYAYNLAGQLTRTTLPDGTATAFAFDQAGRTTATTHLDKDSSTVLSTSSGTYDADGNAITATDADGHTSTYTFDADDQLTQQVQPVTASSSITTSFGYDAAGNRTQYTHTRTAGGAPASVYYTFNSMGLPESTVEPPTAAYPNPADGTYTLSYDAAGEVVRDTQPGGVSESYGYDADGRKTSQSGAGAEATTATRTFGYDLDSRLTSATAGSDTNTYTYDDRGLVLGQAGAAGVSSFGYDALGNMTSRTDGAGAATFNYDADDRLAGLTDPLTGTQKTYQYDSASDLVSTSAGAGSATRTFGYDGLHRIVSDTLTNPGGAVEASIAYGYDPAGHTTSKTTAGTVGSGANSYSYDWAGRLTSWTGNSGTTSYSYDNDGNLTQSGPTTSTYDDRDRRVSSSGATFTYDARGALTATTRSAATTQVSFDAFDQQVTNGTSSYSYDALGRLAATGSATFSYDRTSDDATSDGTSSYERDPGGNLIALTTAAGPVLAYSDSHEDLVGTYTATGSTLASSTSFDPWGAVLAAAGSTSSIGYQDDWTDPGTKLLNTAARWYDPSAGSFTSRDTATLAPTTAAEADRYAYGAGHPLDAVDRSGHNDIEPQGGGFAGGLSPEGGDGPGAEGEAGEGPHGSFDGKAPSVEAGDHTYSSPDDGQSELEEANERALEAEREVEAERNLHENEIQEDQRIEDENEPEVEQQDTNADTTSDDTVSTTGDGTGDSGGDGRGGRGSTSGNTSRGSTTTTGRAQPARGTTQSRSGRFVDPAQAARTPSNTVRPMDNSTPTKAANNTITPQPGNTTSTPGDSPTNPLQIQADSNPAASASSTVQGTVDAAQTDSCGPDGEHVVLGVGEHSDALAGALRDAGDAGAHTFNDSNFGDIGEGGIPEWMHGVMRAAGSPDTRLSITLDGLPGATPEEAFQNAYIRGVGAGLKGAAQGGYGTAWEMSVVGRNAYFNSVDSDLGRSWSSIQFYWRGAPADVQEPNWAALRGLAGQ